MAALRELNLFVNVTTGQLVQGRDSTVPAVLPRFVFGDSIPVSVQILSGNSAPLEEADLTDKTIRLGIGNLAGNPAAGTWTATFGANTTSALPYNIDSTALQTALNALASITSAGGVTVTSSSSGVYRIVFNTAGSRGAITADTATLYPSTAATVAVALEGSVSAREVVLIALEVQPAAYVELTDELPSAALNVEMIRAGATGVGEIQKITLSPAPYDGSFALSIDGETTGAISFDATAEEIQSAIAAIATYEDAGAITVTGSFPSWTLSFASSFGAIGAVVPNVAGLIVPKGRKGSLNTNTAGVIELLDGAQTATATLEIEVYDTDTSTPQTVCQTNCTVAEDIIPSNPASSTPLPQYLDQSALNAAIAALAIIEPAGTSITDPIDPETVTWKKVKQAHKVSPIDEKFICWDEDFESGSTLCFEGGENPSALIEKGIFYPVRGESYVADTGKSDDPDGDNNSGLFRIPFLVSCVDVVSRAGSADDAINVGFNISRFPDTSLYIVQARYSPVTNQAAIFFLNNGSGTTAGASSYTATFPFKLALTIGDKSAAAWIKEEGKDWVLVSRAEFPDGFDITDPAVMERLQPSLYTAVTPGETETWAVSRFCSGYAGNIGIANQAFLRFEDGTPVIKDNKAFFIANGNIASATGGAFSEINLSANCVSVFSIDLATYKVECVSKINTLVAGKLYGENSGCAVYDRTQGKWILLIPNWASKNTDAGSTLVYCYETKDDLLHGIHVLENGVRVMLPGTTSQYDPDIVKIDGVWYCAFAATNTLTGWSEYYSTLAKLNSGTIFDPNGTWELIGQNTETPKAEGQKIQKIGGVWHVLGYFEGLQIYSFDDMSTVATIPVPYENPLINNHPNIMHVTRGGRTFLLWVGWLNDAYEGQDLSWGSVQIMESNQFQIGREFPRVRLPWSE